MHIELTDHLCCPADHPEAFLVLLPDLVEERNVVAGQLGCPVCGWSTAWTDGTPNFGGVPTADDEFPFDADAAVALLGIDGPGGWIATAGSAGLIATAVGLLLPGVRVVAINPPAKALADLTNVILSERWPIKTASMRGVVVGADVGARDRAVLSALPGLRACGAGEIPGGPSVDVVGSAGEAWVVKLR